ncbi:MAG: hypothetical protein ABMA02_07910 [Saprospiraceae bacterium]
MSLHHRLYQIECLDHFIRRRRTGAARQIAEHLRISKRAVFDLLDTMHDLGAEIRWCPQRRNDKEQVLSIQPKRVWALTPTTFF